MPSTFDDAFARVKELAETFKAGENHYLSPQYQEAEARRDFIDKFLIALGWDVNHDTQKNPYEQEVKVERKEHGVSQRRADYAFYLAPNFRDVKFYIEAKKPFGDIATTDNYFQTVRYGWNSKTPIAALFDFEQFEIVDCRFKPDLETALQRNLKKFHFSQFADKEKFAEIYWLFSREAVAGGALEKYAESLPKKRGAVQRGLFKGGYQSIDDAFLEELDAHRDTLAHIFKNNNPQLDGETLTEVTQRTLDRLVFIRFLEDKLIEPHYLVSKFGERGSAWGDFIATSRRLDGIYNGIVFKKNEILDSPGFKVDDDQFGEICKRLSHINSPYDFNAIPIHILGSIYERFLGKVIVATAKRATVEEKPEVRKAGGVYYTPEYIVRYIVENTVGRLIEGKSPAQIAELRFADIACGSGSFLLGVYDLLLRHHVKFYNTHPGKAKKGETVQRDDGLHLSLQKKREILVNNIYGVDIDTQAVEVAQLSLYLKLLADETPASARGYQMEFSETLLPTLTKNIVCGNSLIGTDISSGDLFEPVEERKLNPMDYEQRFPEIVKRGGFDAIVGNPPYGMVIDEIQKNYFNQKYVTVEGRFDTFELFIEKATKLVRKRGLVGYIVPSPLLTNVYSRKLRRYLLEFCSMLDVTNFSMPVFADPTVHTCIVIVETPKKNGNRVGVRKRVVSISELNQPFDYTISQEKLGSGPNTTLELFADPTTQKLIEKLSSANSTLGDICFIRQCIKTGNDDVYVKSAAKPPGGAWKPSLRGRSIGRYATCESDLYLKYGDWLARNWKNQTFYERSKIAIRETGSRITATLDRENRYFLSSLYAIYPKSETEKHSLQYLLALLNSNIANYFLRVVAFALTEGAFTKARTNQLARLPIRSIDFSKPADKARHDKLVSLVEQMLAAKPQLVRAQSDKDKDFYANKCAALDRQMDALVYELYALTPEEINIVEGVTK